MAIEDDNLDASTPSSTDTSAASTPEPEPTSSRSDPAQSADTKTRSPLNQALRAALDEGKKEPSKARQAAAAQRSREEGTARFAPETDKERAAKAALPAPNTIPAKVERPAKAAPEATQVPSAAQPAASAPAASTTAAAMPTSWPKEAKDHWASLPPAVQQAVAKREQEVASGFAQYKTRYEDIDRAFPPQRDAYLQQLGKTRGQAVEQLFSWHDRLGDPRSQAQAFRELAQAHRFDLSTLAQIPGQSQQQQDPNDPRAIIQQAVQQALQGYVQPLDQRLSQWERQQQQQQQAEVNSSLATFSKDKPHFDRVRMAMGQMIQAGYATTLDDAYQKATWADPEVRAEMQAAADAKREAEAKAAADAQAAKAAQDAEAERKRNAEQAAKARRANVSPRSTTPIGTAAPVIRGGKSVKESVAETMRDMRASI